MPPATFLGPFDEVGLNPPAAGAGGPKVLANFAMQPQRQSNWCWAAVLASLCAFFGDTDPDNTSQCKLAGSYTGLDCCADPAPCNKPMGLESALGDLGHLAQPAIADRIDFNAVRAQIDLGRPVCCHIRWNGAPDADGGHFVAIVGYDAAGGDIIVRDPDTATPHNGAFPYDRFEQRIGGQWDQSYLTK